MIPITGGFNLVTSRKRPRRGLGQAPVVPPVEPGDFGLVFADYFNKSTSVLDQSVYEDRFYATINNNRVKFWPYFGATFGDGPLLRQEFPSDEVIAEVDFIDAENDYAYVGIKITDPSGNNGYAVYMRERDAISRIGRIVDGVFTATVFGTRGTAPPFKVKVRFHGGNTIELYKDDVLVESYVDPDPIITQGTCRVGLVGQINAVSIGNNFKVYAHGTTIADIEPPEAENDVIPLGDKYELVYEGGFRLPGEIYGAGQATYSTGAIGVDETTNTLWVAGHIYNHAIAAFDIPTLVKTHNVASMPYATNKDPYVKVASGLEQAFDPGDGELVVEGIQLIGGKLWVNSTRRYGPNNRTTVVFDTPHDLSNSAKLGAFNAQGGNHSAGWMTPIPAALQPTLGGEYIMGNGPNLSINPRYSMGPTLFAWNPSTALPLAAGGTIQTSAVIDYSLSNPLVIDDEYQRYVAAHAAGELTRSRTDAWLYNEIGGNDLWLELSQARIGFIPAGSSDYIVLGSTAGITSPIVYKGRQDNATLDCGGPCQVEHEDTYNYFWRYDLNDASDVIAGNAAPHTMRVAEYGFAPVLFGRYRGRADQTNIGGAAYSPDSSKLYISITDGNYYGQFSRTPLILVYTLREKVAPV